ncbi:MAG: transcriptional regulator [Chloroflexota bacterium]|nr:MAG: transcriptional regulator [Chloroflexota bacterium]
MIDLTALLKTGESETLEFKERWNDAALQTVAALANTQGGILVVGVNNKGEVVGWQGGEKQLRVITDEIAALRVHPSITEQEHAGHKVLVVQVTKASMYVACHGRYYRRVGNTTRDIPSEELGQLLRDQVNWDSLTEDYPMSEIDEDSVRKFLQMARERLPHAKEDESTESILEKLQLLRGGKLTRGAILLFGKNPQQYFPMAQIHMGRFKDATTIVDDKLLRGNLFQQQEQASQLFRQYLQVRFEIPGSITEGQEPLQAFRRREIWDYPLDALREAVVNALVHRDYFNTSMDIMIRVYDDEVLITNPGGLPQGVTVDDLKRERHASIHRNLVLAQVFYYAKLVEKWGTGTSRMVEMCQEHGLPELEFMDAGVWFQVTFSKDPYTKERLLRMGLTERQVQAILLVKERGSITNTEYQERQNVAKRTATRDLSDLVDRGIFEQVGRRGKGIAYRLRSVAKGPVGP